MSVKKTSVKNTQQLPEKKVARTPTMSNSNPLTRFKTKSGKPITIGTGVGTKWQWLKKAGDEPFCQPLIDQVELSIKCGFNHIDTADCYTTAPDAGKAIENSGVKREDLFITSKYSPIIVKDLKPAATLTEGFNRILSQLNTDYLDLFLIHSPFFAPEYGYTIESIWEELISLKKAGKVRHIGVSNYRVSDIERSMKVSPSEDYYPVVNQVEFHPFLQEQSAGIMEFCEKHNILVEGYKTLSPITIFADEEMNAYLEELSQKYNKTSSQILLKYDLQKGVLPITTSSNEQRIKDSLNLDFTLDSNEIATIDKIGSKEKKRVMFSELDDPNYQ